jgi:hypothetical protein
MMIDLLPDQNHAGTLTAADLIQEVNSGTWDNRCG